MSGQLSKAQAQEMERSTGQSQRLKQTDQKEVESKASATGGLNLNLGAVVSGIFGGKRDKTTDTNPDGSSHSEAHTKGRGAMTGDGVANLDIIGTGEGTTTKRHIRSVEGTQEQIDHLGMRESNAIEAKK